MDKKIYECGNLKMSIWGVTSAIALIVLGFFAYTFAATSVVQLMPLHIKDIGASDTLLVFVMTTIAGIINVTVCPWVSFKSDRYRGKRWGRRTFYIISTVPLYGGSIILFGFADPIGNFVAKMFNLAPGSTIIALIAGIMFFYCLFENFVGSVIYYIYNDAIPPQFVARATGLVNLARSTAVTVFNFTLLRHGRTYFGWIMIGNGLLYIIALTIFCLLIKERTYPPLTEEEKKQSNGLQSLPTFMRESFSHPLYWYISIACAIFVCGSCIGTVLNFMHLNMGLTLKDIGNMNGIAGSISFFVGIAIATLGAFLVDKWNPVRVYTCCVLISAFLPLSKSIWAFIDVTPTIYYNSTLCFSLLVMAFSSLMGLASMPYLMRVFPSSRFGQFCSAMSMFRALIVMLANLLFGMAIDFGRKLLGGGDTIYRYIHIWQFVCYVIGGLFYILAYIEWQKLGGEKAYRAPATWSESKFEDMEHIPTTASTSKLLNLSLITWDACVALFAIAFFAIPRFFVSNIENVSFLPEFLNSWIQSITNNPEFSIAEFSRLTAPITLAMVIAWIATRIFFHLKVNSSMKAYGELRNLPYFGIVLITGIQQLLLFIVTVCYTIFTVKQGTVLTAKFWNIGCGVFLFLWIVLLVLSFTEKGSQYTTTEVANA